MAMFGDARLPDRIWGHIVPEPMSGCWLWTASCAANGYGQTSWTKRNCKVHRVAYETLVGQVTAGLDLDHLCRVRSCCNPDHLEPITRSENLRRGAGGDPLIGQRRAAQLIALTHCRNGHPFDPDNTIWRSYRSGLRRICQQCVRNRNRRRSGSR
jgi:hypothetical protein